MYVCVCVCMCVSVSVSSASVCATVSFEFISNFTALVSSVYNVSPPLNGRKLLHDETPPTSFYHVDATIG